MHELPANLTHSLGSYRGGIYGSSRRGGGDGADEGADLEKGQGAYDEPKRRTDSSIILVRPSVNT